MINTEDIFLTINNYFKESLMFSKEGMKDIIEGVYSAAFFGIDIDREVLRKIIDLYSQHYAKVIFPTNVKFVHSKIDGKPVITLACRKLSETLGYTTYEYGVSYCSKADVGDFYEGKLQAFNRLGGNNPAEHSGRTVIKTSAITDAAVIFGILDVLFRANNAPYHLREEVSSWLVEIINEVTAERKKRLR